MCCWLVSAEPAANELHRMQCGLCDQHDGWFKCHCVHGMHCWSFQQYLNHTVRALSRRLGDRRSQCVHGSTNGIFFVFVFVLGCQWFLRTRWINSLHCVYTWPIHQRVDHTMRHLCCRIYDRYIVAACWHNLHDVFGRAIQQCVDRGMCRVSSRCSDEPGSINPVVVSIVVVIIIISVVVSIMG